MNKIYKIAGFTPFVLVAFLNAFIDWGHKIILLHIINKSFDERLFYSFLVNVLVVLPFIFAFSLSGFVSDRFNKSKILKLSALASILLLILLLVCYVNGLFWVSFGFIFLLSLQSAFHSPAKYGYIKELVGKENLTWGNGAIQAATIVGMLLGGIIFTSLFNQFANVSPLDSQATQSLASQILQSITFLAIILLIFGVLEFILSLFLPATKATKIIPATQDEVPTQNLVFTTQRYLKLVCLKENLSLLKKHKIVFLAIVFTTILWSILQLLIDIFPVYLKNELEIDDTGSINTLLIASGVGMIIGCIISGRCSKNYIETGLIPLGACFVFISIFFLTWFDSLTLLCILFFVFGLGLAFCIVPLNTLMQFYSTDSERGRTLAGSNFLQNLGMLLALILAFLCSVWFVEIQWLFSLLSLLSFIAMAFMLKAMPFSLVRFLISIAILQRYKLIVEGFSNIPKHGGVLLLGNHISFIDWAIIQMAVPKKVHFVMERNIYSRWYIRLFIDFFGVIPVSSLESSGALKKIQRHINNGDMVCLFPERTISRHGHLNEFKDDYEKIAINLSKRDAVILPFYICGMWGSIFSRSREQFRERKRSFSKRVVSIAFGEHLEIHTPKDKLKAKIFEMGFKAWEHQCKNSPTLAGGFIESAKRGGNDIAIIDTQSGSISYRRLLTLCIMLSQDIKELDFGGPDSKDSKDSKDSESTFDCTLNNQCIGILLPSSNASVICNLATALAGKIMVNLNFTAGKIAIRAAIESAKISHIYTSKKFLERLATRGVELDFNHAKIHYMEDIVMEIRKHKFAFLINLAFVSLAPTWLLKLLFAKDSDIDSVCAILFSSGSEGTPKGVMLSNLNIMSNIAQIADVIHAQNDECILASLPPFHAFGLTVTTFMPLIENMMMVCHADPTDALGIAKAVALNKVTIMCATSTLLGIYARNAKLDKVMFDSVRLTVAGAEKLKSEVREAYTMKFNKPIFEGYGATETTPVASVNLPDEFDALNWQIHKASKIGSVGMPLPGSVIRITDPDTLEDMPTGQSGLILIGGHQIMKGYLNDAAKTSEVIVEMEGIRWYKSGDKGYVDSDGFLHIVDRYSRFVKIGGEMVGLGGLEEEIDKILKTQGIESKICAIGLEDAKKGERIVLLIESANRSHLDSSRLDSGGSKALSKESSEVLSRESLSGDSLSEDSKSETLKEAGVGSSSVRTQRSASASLESYSQESYSQESSLMESSDLIDSRIKTHDLIINAIKNSNLPPLKKPSAYFVVESIPILGSGKVDLKSAKELAKRVDAEA